MRRPESIGQRAYELQLENGNSLTWAQVAEHVGSESPHAAANGARYWATSRGLPPTKVVRDHSAPAVETGPRAPTTEAFTGFVTAECLRASAAKLEAQAAALTTEARRLRAMADASDVVSS